MKLVIIKNMFRSLCKL